MTGGLAWLVDANAVSEMMRPRPEGHRLSRFHRRRGAGYRSRHGLGDSRRYRSARSWPAPPRTRRMVPGPSRRPVRGSGRRVVSGGCAGVRADYGGPASARPTARRPCSGRFSRGRSGCSGRARPCYRHPQAGEISEHRRRNGGSLEWPPVLSFASNASPLPFGLSASYRRAGQISRFTNGRDPNPRSREVFSVHRSETLNGWVQAQESLRSGISSLPPLCPVGLHMCQVTAVIGLEATLS